MAGPGGLTVGCNNPPSGQLGKPYGPISFLPSGGTPPYIAWAIIAGSLPPGLTLNTVTGEVAGTPTTKGTFNFTVQVTDSVPSTASVACSISICGLNSQGS